MRNAVTVLALLIVLLWSAEGNSFVPGWQKEEKALARALAIRAKGIEEATPFRFQKDWRPEVGLEWSIGDGSEHTQETSIAEYDAATQTIHFVVSLMYEMNVRHKIPLRLLAPRSVAHDHRFAEIADHELGHALMDQVSRREGQGPWFTKEHFAMLSQEGQLGLNIVSEGVGEYFGRLYYSRATNLSELAFPENPVVAGFYSFRTVARLGGYWLVRDILEKYGDRGLAWLVRHPFVVDNENVRASAVAYREQALHDLAS